LSKFKLTYKAFGLNAVLIEWQPQQISDDVLKDVQWFQHQIESELSEYIIEYISAYASLTVVYKQISFQNLVDVLKASYQKQKKKTNTKTNIIWQLPVCYHSSLGFDLNNYSQKVQLSIEEIIDLHTSTIYTVYFLGFLPGFLYLGKLDKRLHCSRKSSPLLSIPKGSVGIGGKQTGIYPQASPGGWHIIGNCPLSLFNVKDDPPSPFKPGDQIQFYAISLDDFQKKSFSLTKKNTHA